MCGPQRIAPADRGYRRGGRSAHGPVGGRRRGRARDGPEGRQVVDGAGALLPAVVAGAHGDDRPRWRARCAGHAPVGARLKPAGVRPKRLVPPIRQESLPHNAAAAARSPILSRDLNTSGGRHPGRRPPVHLLCAGCPCLHAHLFCVTTRVSVTGMTVSAFAFQALQGPGALAAFSPATL